MTSPAPHKHLALSWEVVHRDAKALAEKLRGEKWLGLIAVTRGGLVPAAVVARELEIRVIETVSVISYDDANGLPSAAKESRIVKHPTNVGDGSGWLVIDDLVDTGCTTESLRRLIPKAHFATIYAKPMGKPRVDTFVREVSQDTWLCFPWEGGAEQE